MILTCKNCTYSKQIEVDVFEGIILERPVKLFFCSNEYSDNCNKTSIVPCIFFEWRR